MIEEDYRLYLVRETKATQVDEKRRKEENDKIVCGGIHFGAVGVDFGVAITVKEILTKLAAKATA